MTAAAGVLTGLAKLKRQDSQHRPIGASSGPGASPPEAAPRRRKRRSDIVVVRGRLRLYSPSGFFLLLGLVILTVGIGMATLGYWPHGENAQVSRTKPEAEGGSRRMASGGSKAAAAGNATAAAGDGGGGKLTVKDGDIEVKTNSSTGNIVRASSGKPSKQARGALSHFLEQHLHSERMKMLGPFTMGIGIFIFICANAILHENRDQETKVIHMRDMYSTVIDIHRLRQKERKHQQHGGCFSGEPVDLRNPGAENAGTARLASNSLLTFSSRAGMGSLGGGEGGGSTEEEEVLLGDGEYQRPWEKAHVDCGFGGLLAPLYRDRPFGAVIGLCHSDALRPQWSVEREREKGGHHARSIVSSSLSAFTLPVIKLNNCVIDEPEMEAITEEERGGERREGARQGERSRPLGSMESLAVPVAMVAKASKPLGLHRSNSASSSSHSSLSSCSLSPAPSSTSGCWLSPGAARSDFGSNSSLHMLSSHSKSLDLERRPSILSVHPEQRKHPSWPRLDYSNSVRCNGSNRGARKGYVRLEDREEQGDRFLDVDPDASARRDYSKRDKLLMISRSHNNLSFEHNEFNSSTLKRGSSETRF